MTKPKTFLFALALSLLAPLAQAAGPGPVLEASHASIGDRASLQRGAKYFVNYCQGCHSLGLLRYSRMADDLGLTEEQVMQNLSFGAAKFGEPMVSSLGKADATAWLGAPAPDLSLTARAKLGGPDWIYTYLKSFYVDETRPMGWNNTVLPGASMPHVLWELQGIQRPVYGPSHDGAAPAIERFELSKAGRLSPQEYDQVARDISAFLAYAAEPAAMKREAIGVWVLAFLSFFALMTYMLKAEFWRDVH